MKTRAVLFAVLVIALLLAISRLRYFQSDVRPLHHDARRTAVHSSPDNAAIQRKKMTTVSPVLTGPMPRILLLGDSITQQSFGAGGWGSAVANWYMRRADVINRGLSGYNTRWVRHHLSTISETMPSGGEFQFGTIFFGANDCAANHQHVPVAEYKANLKALVEWMHSIGIKRVVLMTPPPMAPEKHILARNLHPEDETRTDAAHAQYGDAMKEVGVSLGVPVVDVRGGIMHALGANWRDALWDGLHLSPQGNDICFQLLQRSIELHFPEIVPVDARPMLLPYHGDQALHNLPAFPETA